MNLHAFPKKYVYFTTLPTYTFFILLALCMKSYSAKFVLNNGAYFEP